MVRSINKSRGDKKIIKRPSSSTNLAEPSIRSCQNSNSTLPQGFEEGKEPAWFKRAIKEWKDSTVRMPD
jgi:hypothetical protein